MSKKLDFGVGAYLALQIIGNAQKYVGEVVQQDPLVVKVCEDGPYARLKDGDFIILKNDSVIFQSEDNEKIGKLLQKASDSGNPFASGLLSLGITDGCIHEMLPG